ncbi:MAG: DUF134 domain-containing protein [Thermodesulfovibrionales bacterium]
MPRYKKPRRCHCPFSKLQGKIFKPAGISSDRLEFITLYRDELEALRLCYKECLTQEEAGKKMGISRGTVQRLLSSARKKIASAFSECKGIIFQKEENIKSS